MTPEQLRQRTKEFGLRIVKLVSAMPNNRIGDIFSRQVLRSGTSIGSNYREASRASTKKQFIYTMEISLREADETLYWLELIADSKLFKPAQLAPLLDECYQLIAILVTAIRTSKAK